MRTIDPPDRDSWAENMVSLYAALIIDRIHFAQAVYGDGEWRCIFGMGTHNSNDEVYAPELRDGLLRTLTEPVGQWCVLWPGGAGPDARARVSEWIARHQPDIRWIPFRPICWAAVFGFAGPFFEAVRSRRVVLVGPEHMKRLPAEVVDPSAYVTVPDGSAWRVVEEMCQSVRDAVEVDDLVLFSSGMASNLAIHALWPELRGRATLFDLGSVLDPYCGVFSRRAYQDPVWQRDIMPQNLPNGGIR